MHLKKTFKDFEKKYEAFKCYSNCLYNINANLIKKNS